MDDLPLDTERIQRYMISIPNLSGSQVAPTATEGTIIPVQVALDTSQGVLVPAVNMVRPQFSPPAAHQQTSPTLNRSSPQVMGQTNVILQGHAQIEGDKNHEGTLTYTVEDLSRQKLGQNKAQSTPGATGQPVEIVKDISELAADIAKQNSSSKSEVNKQNLHSVISHLISTQTAAIMKEDEIAAQHLQFQNEAAQCQRSETVIEIDPVPTDINDAVQKIVEKSLAAHRTKEMSPQVSVPAKEGSVEILSTPSVVFSAGCDKSPLNTPMTITVNPTTIEISPKETSQQVSPGLKGNQSLDNKARDSPEHTSPAGAEDKGKVRHRSRDSNSSGSLSPNSNKIKAAEKKARSQVVVPAPPAAITYDKFGGTIFYDYTLPDRGLGTGAIGQTASASNSKVKSWHCPQSPAQLSIPSPSLSDRGGTSPLDLSSVPKEARKDVMESPPARKSRSPTSNSERSSPDVQQDRSEKSGGITPQKVLYEKNMLIFSDNEVEIISVGNNKWVVRNESQLLSMANRGTHHLDLSPHKRPNEEDVESPVGLKVPKLTNGNSPSKTINGATVDKSCLPLTNGNLHSVSANTSREIQPGRESKNCPVLQNMLNPKTL